MNNIKKLKRIKRVRSKIFGTAKRPRLSVYRSNKFIYGQLIDDEKGKTLLSVSDKELKLKDAKATKSNKAKLAGQKLAEKSKTKKITQVVFDRGSYRYHGRVKSFADGAREGGLKF
jgi:large subunit ribosomal protein L18